MSKQEVKEFFQSIHKLKLTKLQKKRMLNLFQVRGSNNKNKSMSYKEFAKLLTFKKGKIKSLVIGPKWNRLVFVDINVEV
tara:strand:+ start:193 stop:432 length:240 start_codon:yes stop_codon:yes gene_type:complete